MGFGDGYDEDVGPLLNIQQNDDGTLSIKDGKAQRPQLHSSSAGIGSSPNLGGNDWPSEYPIEPGDWPPVEPVIPPVQPPTARFAYTEYTDGVVQFLNISLGIYDVLYWEFGDGETSTEENPEHTYSSGGNYIVRVTAINQADKVQDTYELQLTVSDLPTVVDYEYEVGGYKVYCTNKATNAKSSYLWDFGDGITSTETHPNHQYADGGSYTITLTVDKESVSQTVDIDVEILLEWTDNSGSEDGFRIERSPNGTDSWVEVATVGSDVEQYGVTYAQDGIRATDVNYFRVYAYAGEDDSENPTNVVQSQCGG